ncbi:MAG: monovalent cation/H+ antiporter complex subunit F [Chloroflexaceae bacterium]
MSFGVIAGVATLVLGMLIAALFLAFVRLLRGPSIPDRVVALDLIAVISVGVIAAYIILTNEPAFLDTAIVLSLISFLGTVAFAFYIERGAAR